MGRVSSLPATPLLESVTLRCAASGLPGCATTHVPTRQEPMEGIRCLKRYAAREVFNLIRPDSHTLLLIARPGGWAGPRQVLRQRS